MIIKNLFINTLRQIINKFDISIVKKNVVNFDQNFDYSKLNLSELNIVKNYKLKNLITTAGKKLGSVEDPYYFALKESLPIVDEKTFIQSFTKIIKSIIKSPRTAGEAINLKKSKKLSEYPEWALVLPWEDISIEENYRTYLNQFVSKRARLKKIYEISNKENRDKIIYNDLAWESHAKQFLDLHKSISKNGFKEINFVPVHLFKYNNLFHLSLGDDGNHRTRVAYVLDIQSIPLKISKIVDFENINNWVNVKNGLYSLEEAEKIFINYFNYKGNGAYV